MKYLIAGLGNIGDEYRDTRHNIGFMILDVLAGASNAVFMQGRYACFTEIRHRGRQLILIKPTTYMNLSGKAVNYWLQTENIPVENLMIVLDDIALPFGKIRIRATGSDGGHNGLKHISHTLGHSDYIRLRFGIGGIFPEGGQVDYVLSSWTYEEKKLLPERTSLAAEAIKSFSTIGIERTMNFFNNK